MESATPPYLRLRARLLEALLEIAPFEGWGPGAVRQAAVAAGLSEGEAELAAPRGGADLIDALELWADDRMADGLTQEDWRAMKVRQRVTRAVALRLEALTPHREAVRRAVGANLAPWRALNPPRFVWRTADRIWRTLEDTSTDANWYSKRAVLSAVLASTFLAWLGADGEASWRDFLDRRIAGVMQFEKLKAQVNAATTRLPDVAGWLGRMRYRA
jgi:ubiquinone biosynthesis protein COQ9